MKPRQLLALLLVAALAALLAACAPGSPTTSPANTQTPISTAPVSAPSQAAEATQAPAATFAPAASTATPPDSAATARPTPAATGGPTATPVIEVRVVELEWPPRMRLGESDVVRLSLAPLADGYVVITEFEDHQTVTQTLAIEQLIGYELWGVARLDAAGFTLSPDPEQTQRLAPGSTATWRWTLRPNSGGQQRLAVSLRLRWAPLPDNPAPPRETTLYTRAVTVQVLSFFGLTAREAAMLGIVGLVFGSTLSLPLAAHALRPRGGRRLLPALVPNASLVIERPAGLELSTVETDLLRALFKPYGRLALEAEFRSGYSGARTFLAQPIRPDGRADAYTIAKIGATGAIRQEYDNYETFVKDTLPPVTARIQSAPVTVKGQRTATRRGSALETGSAALRYTFIGEPGRSPQSLRQALLAAPDPALLEKLFATFGPHWWRQRRPYTFRLGREYDRMLPAHCVVEPAPAGALGAAVLDGRQPPGDGRQPPAVGDMITLRGFTALEMRPDGQSLSLAGPAAPGHPPLRVRWLSLAWPEGATGRIVATRDSLLRDLAAGCNRHGLPDPLARLPELLGENISGTQSTIHGDLNLENVLVGPGGFVWLIDFAQTRDGHPLYDFAHLEAGVIAHVLSPQAPSDAEFLRLLEPGAHPLLSALRAITTQCLFDPAKPREYQLALFMACVGSLKYSNLDQTARQRLYLTAAYLAKSL